jgi:hypothetical protein
MPKRRRHSSLHFVEHPRYGSTPHTSGLEVAEDEIREGFWSLKRETMFPESVLAADATKQNYSVFPRRYYVDVQRQCRMCDRPFIFFAREQRYWYETLRFFVDADCVHCPDCRRESRTSQRRIRRYSDLMAKQAHTPQELEALVDDALYLFARGALRNVTTLGALKNKALRAIPTHPGTSALAEVLAKARRSHSAA